jgi:hypothetical protein
MKTAIGLQIQSAQGCVDLRFSTMMPRGIDTSRFSIVFNAFLANPGYAAIESSVCAFQGQGGFLPVDSALYKGLDDLLKLE